MAAPDRAVTLKQFAQLLDVSPGYVTELKQAGRLVLNDKGRVLADASRASIAATADPAKDGVRARHAATRGRGAAQGAVDPSEGDSGADPADTFEPLSSDAKRRARALADAAEADTRKKLRDEQVELGLLWSADEVAHGVSGAIATLRNGLENLPAILAPQVAAETDEAKCRVLMLDAIEHALEELARQFTAIGKVEAA